MTIDQLGSILGITVSEAKAATDYLLIQTLITCEDGKFTLRPDLPALIPEPGRAST
jgi:hypothetical protein